MQTPAYKRVLLKLSGEALKQEAETILDFDYIDTVVAQIAACVKAGVQVAVVIGAGNIWRGARGTDVNRTRADHMGMLGTCINALALQDVFMRHGMDTVVMSAVEMDTFADHYSARNANRALAAGKIAIFSCGTGAPYFSTDTGAALRAAEIHADAMLLAKNIDYVYDSDPKKNPDAKPLYDLTYAEIIERDLRAFDMSAVIFCQDNNIEAYGFGLADPENIYRAVMGEPVGTRMHN